MTIKLTVHQKRNVYLQTLIDCNIAYAKDEQFLCFNLINQDEEYIYPRLPNNYKPKQASNYSHNGSVLPKARQRCGFRAGFGVENFKIRVSDRVPGCVLASMAFKKPSMAISGPGGQTRVKNFRAGSSGPLASPGFTAHTRL